MVKSERNRESESAARKKKTTFRVDPEILSQFTTYMKDLGLRRDTWLNSVLLAEVALLRRVPRNSPRASILLDLMRERDAAGLQKVGITLDSDLLAEINNTCEEKLIPRDVFFEHALKFFVLGSQELGEGAGVSPLVKAASIISDPSNEWYDMGDSPGPYNSLTLSEDTVEEMIYRLQEEPLS